MKERHNAILEYITTHGKTEVSILAEKLHTSEVTIRKDLDLLEEKGMLKRERGYAVPNDPGNIFYRMAFHPDLKQRIARTAADCVSDGETVMIETGSTCILFAEELARTRKNVTIVTNSVCLAEYVRKYTNVQLILLGGILLGIIEIFAKAYISTQLSDAIVFAVLIVVLVVRPAGLLGKQVREKV